MKTIICGAGDVGYSIADKLSKDMGGWIFHQKIDWDAKTPSVKINHGAKEYIES